MRHYFLAVIFSIILFISYAQPCVVTMDLPDEVCTVDNSFDLFQYVSVPGGIWNIPGGIFDPSIYAPGSSVLVFTF